MAQTVEHLGIIAGNGSYPRLLAAAARKAGTKRITVAAFTGETDPAIKQHVDTVEWLRVGQLNKLLGFFRDAKVHQAVMAGQIAPRNLFNLRPDWKALLILAKLKRRNAETIFAAIGDELAKVEVELLPATIFMDEYLAPAGLIAGPKLNEREEEDVEFGWQIAKEIARLDIGQTVIVKNGTVLAVEGFDGTNETIKRGGRLGRKDAIMVKVSKPKQDMRFDVPVIGTETIAIAKESRLRAIVLEAGKTLLLDSESVEDAAKHAGISLFAR